MRAISHPLLAIGSFILTAALHLGCSAGRRHSEAPQPAPIAAPTIASFTCTGSLIQGQPGLLGWSVTGATTTSLDNGIGPVVGTSWWVNPLVTTTYTLTATNAGGTTKATCTMAVYPADAGTMAILASIPATAEIDGQGADARFFYPRCLALDKTGNMWVTEAQELSLRMVTPEGLVTSPFPSIWAGVGTPSQLAVGPDGTFYASLGSALYQLHPGGTPTLLAGSVSQTGSADGPGSSATFNGLGGIAVGATGIIYVSDTGNNTIRAITPEGTVTTLAGRPGVAQVVDGTGAAATFYKPAVMTMTPSGNLIVGGTGGNGLRQVTPQGVVTTLPGNSTVNLYQVGALAAGADGSIYVGGESSIAKLTPQGVWIPLAGTEGQLGLVNGPGPSAKFTNISGLAVDAAGNLVAVDCQNMVLRMVTPAGMVSTLAGTNAGGSFGTYSPAVDSSGNVFLPTSNNTLVKISPAGTVVTLAGVSGQGGSTDGPGASALFGLPVAAAVDAAGTVYVSDRANATIRKIDSSGNVTTLAGKAGQTGTVDGQGAAARFNGPNGIAVDTQGNVYVVDTDSSTIRKITSGGLVTTVAGTAGKIGNSDGTAGSALFCYPSGVAIDAGGNLFVADTGNGAIRKIDPGGNVTTLPFALGYLGSVGASANFGFFPSGIALDMQGNLYVTNAYSSTSSILQVTPTGNASWVPVYGLLDGGLKGITVQGGTIYLSYAWGVWTVSL